MKNWKYWVIRKMKPASEKNTIVTDPLAAVKRRLRNSPRSSSGSGVRRSQAMNAAKSATATTKPAMLRAELQP